MLNKKEYLWLHLFLLIVSMIFTFPLIDIFMGMDHTIRLIIFLAIWYMIIVGIAGVFYNKRTAHGALAVLYSLNLLNILFMINFAKFKFTSLVIAILASIAAILITVLYNPDSEKKKTPIELPEIKLTPEMIDTQAAAHSTVIEQEEEPQIIDARSGVIHQPTKVTKTFSPSRFIASKKGSTYHSPKCDWAKKISNKNAVWFKSRNQAQSKGYKKCDTCL